MALCDTALCRFVLAGVSERGRYAEGSGLVGRAKSRCTYGAATIRAASCCPCWHRMTNLSLDAARPGAERVSLEMRQIPRVLGMNV